MNVLITGGAGFIGSHIAEAILDAGHNVCLVDNLSTGTLDNIGHLLDSPRVNFVEDSVCDAAAMAPQVERCDVIYHLAAAVGVLLIVDRPVHTIETNIRGTEVILDLAQKHHRKVFIASTSEVYGKSTNIPFCEKDDVTLGPTYSMRWSYACSKMIDEFLALAYHKQHGLEVVAGRFFNTIGPRQTGDYGMVVPRFIRSALLNEPIVIYGTGEQTRCFCNVSDVAAATTRLMCNPKANGQIVNIGSDQPISVEALADIIIDITGSTAGKRHVSYDEAYGNHFDDLLVRQPDLRKMQQLTGYKPKYALELTLKQIIEHEKRLL